MRARESLSSPRAPPLVCAATAASRRCGVRAREQRRGLVTQLNEQLEVRGGKSFALRLVHEEVRALAPHRQQGRGANTEERREVDAPLTRAIAHDDRHSAAARLLHERDGPLLDVEGRHTDRVHRATAAVRKVVQDRDVVGDDDVTSAPREPRRDLHLGPLSAVRLQHARERKTLRLDRMAAADPNGGGRHLLRHAAELRAPLGSQAAALRRREYREADEPPRVQQRKEERVALAQNVGEADRCREGRAAHEHTRGSAEPAQHFHRFTRYPETGPLLGIDALGLDRVQDTDAAVVEHEHRGRVGGQIERALAVREQDPRELAMRRRGGDRRDRRVRGLGTALEPAELRAGRAGERRRREVERAPQGSAHDVDQAGARPQDRDLDDDRSPHRREVEEVGLAERHRREGDGPDQRDGRERLVSREERHPEREREELGDRPGRRGDLTPGTPRRELLDPGGHRERDTDGERARRDLRACRPGLVDDANEREDGDGENDADPEVKGGESPFGLGHPYRSGQVLPAGPLPTIALQCQPAGLLKE